MNSLDSRIIHRLGLGYRLSSSDEEEAVLLLWTDKEWVEAEKRLALVGSSSQSVFRHLNLSTLLRMGLRRSAHPAHSRTLTECRVLFFWKGSGGHPAVLAFVVF